jgi:plasmid maintenance system antidote protein VapI
LGFRPTGSLTSLPIVDATADTALRLSLYFGNSPEFWMNLQTHYDVKMARRLSRT